LDFSFENKPSGNPALRQKSTSQNRWLKLIVEKCWTRQYWTKMPSDLQLQKDL
jgi:hypothetical protein